jgi:hypothetical protein
MAIPSPSGFAGDQVRGPEFFGACVHKCHPSDRHRFTAAETGRTVVSRDAKARFNDMPGVAAISA